MKLKQSILISAALIAAIISASASADEDRRADILQAYYQALRSDPTFKKANSDWESAKQNLPIARAAYLTQIALTGNAQRQFNNNSPALFIPNANGYNYNYGFILNASQPLFNLPAWNAIRGAHAGVKSATATYAAAGQDLMLRLARAYLEVLQAYDQLRFQLARKRSVAEQLKVAQEQFNVGLIAITGVYDARSVYDQAVAISIADQNRLNDAVERLAEITGIHYKYVRGIGPRVPLVKPQPDDIMAWSDVAVSQNYTLMAQNYAVIAARDTLKQQSTSWLPQLSLSGTYTNSNDTKIDHDGFTLPANQTNNVLYGVTMNFPVVQGGLVTANTRQAKYNYLSASNQREFVYRSVLSNTRQSFLGVITGISKIQADWQTVVSAQNALNATKAGYEVGTRTMVDVLDDVTTLYQAQQVYADDQYRYIVDSIELKFYAGTLSVDDIKTVNNWLKKNITLKLSDEALKQISQPLPPIRPYPNVPNASKESNTRFAKNNTSSSKPTTVAQMDEFDLPAPMQTLNTEPEKQTATGPTKLASKAKKINKRLAAKKPTQPLKHASVNVAQHQDAKVGRLAIRKQYEAAAELPEPAGVTQAADIPMPKQTIIASKKLAPVETASTPHQLAEETSENNSLAHFSPMPKKEATSKTVAYQPHNIPKHSESIDDEVLPLYDVPKDNALPSP